MTATTIDYEVLGNPKIVNPQTDLRFPDNGWWYLDRANRNGFETRATLSDVKIEGKKKLRAVVEAIHYDRKKKLYIEFLDGKWHFAQWGERLITPRDVYDLLDGVKDEP